MWLFESLTADQLGVRARFHLIVGEDYRVGRKDCQIIVSKDQSVSRKHAVIRVSHPEANLSKPSLHSTVALQDSSKFGTLVNGKKIGLGSTVQLQNGDQVIFGAMNTNKWKLTYTPLVVAFSSIPSSEKKLLKALVLKLGGHVVSDWSKECTHLVMAQLSVTIKVTAALITCRPIVTPQYLHMIKEAAQNNKDMPDINNFRPPVIEEAVDTKEVNFDPNPVRATIFKDKTFIFMAQKQFKQLGNTIEFGGGKITLMQEGDRQTYSAMTKASSIVMYADPEDSSQAPTQDTQDWIRDVMQHLKKHGLRPIPVSELGLAVLYASTQLHCNPKVAQAGLNLLNATPSQPMVHPEVLAAETEASCSKPFTNVTSKSDDGSRKSASALKRAPASSSSEDERKAAQQSKKRARPDSVPDSASKVLKLEPPSPAPQRRPTSNKIEVADTPQKSSENLQAGPSIKTSPEFSYVGRPTSSKPPESLKEEIVSPPTARKGKASATIMKPSAAGQRSDVIDEEEEAMEMGTEAEASSSVAIDRSDNLQSRNSTKSSGKQKKKSRMATLDSIWDDMEDGGSKQKKRKMKEAALEEEEEGAEQVEEEEKRTLDRVQDVVVAEEEESQNTMWKKKKKRNVLDQIEEDEARESQLSQEQEDASERRDFSQVLSGVPGGFISAANPPKEEEAATKFEPKEELETKGEDDAPPYAVVSIEEGSLVIRRPKSKQAKTSAIIGRTKVKNFKRFRKVGYAGQAGMPQIIGGRDLEEHNNKPNTEIDDMMFGGYQAEQRKTRDEEDAEQLFAAAEPRKKKMVKRR